MKREKFGIYRPRFTVHFVDGDVDTPHLKNLDISRVLAITERRLMSAEEVKTLYPHLLAKEKP